MGALWPCFEVVGMGGSAIHCQILPTNAKHCELVGYAEISPRIDWRMPPHLHPFHELIVVKSGTMYVRTQQGEIKARAGDVLFYESGLVHEEISDNRNPVNTLYIGFRPGQLLPTIPIKMRDQEGRLVEMLSWLIRDRREGRRGANCERLLDAIIEQVEWNLNRPRDPWSEDLRNYMMKNLSATLSLDDIAGRASMSRFAFVRKFKQKAGRTPMEELRLIRLNEARNLILSTGLPLKAIAPAVGIGDEFQLSKLFRRHFHISPGAMRRKAG